MVAYLVITANVYITICLMDQQADLRFGRNQVEQIICDQPDMGNVIKREQALRQMLEWQFAGELNGRRVYWDYREPAGKMPADHLPTFWGYPPLIRVSKKSGTSAVDKCTMLVFELFNLEIDKEYQELLRAPVAMRKSRDQFATSCIRREFEATLKTRSFFRKHPIAEANPKIDPNYFLTVNSTEDFSDYLRFLDGLISKTYNPRKYYREVYDGLLPELSR